MQNKKLLFKISAIGISVISFSILLLPKVREFVKAATPYTCELPDGYVEIHDIVADAKTTIDEIGTSYNVYEDTDYKVRGTITRRVGKTAFMQRVNQTTGELDSVCLYNLPEDESIVEGCVIDIQNPRIACYYGLPQLQFVENTTYNVAFSQNPTGYEPLVYENLTEFNNYAFNNAYGNEIYSYGRLVEVQNLISRQMNDATNATIRDVQLYYPSTLGALEIVITATSVEEAQLIIDTFNYCYDNNKTFSVRGLITFDYGMTRLRIIRSSDILITADYTGSNIVLERRANMWINENYYPELSIYETRNKNGIHYVDVEEFYPTAMTLSGWFNANAYALNVTRNGNEYYFENLLGSMTINVEQDTIVFDWPSVFLFQSLFAEDIDDSNYFGFYLCGGLDTSYISATHVKHYMMDEEYLTIDFGTYDIDLIGYGDKVLMPVTTACNLFCGANNIPITYNGRDLYYTGAFSGYWIGYTNYDEYPLEYKFYTESPYLYVTNRDQELVEYNYNELCFALDFTYGLKEKRGVTSFDQLFEDLGYKDDLLSLDGSVSEIALANFAGEWFYEGHAGYGKVSPALFYSFDIQTAYMDQLSTNARNIQLSTTQNECEALREGAATLSGNPKVNEVGLRTYQNTAIIRFDKFVKYQDEHGGGSVDDIDYQNLSYETLHDVDSYLLMRKAFEELSVDQNIHNVVIDLTTNGGGMVDSIPWLEAFFTSDPVILMRNKVTQEISEVHYSVDLNRDGTVDMNDTYEGQYNFYLLTSRKSFSCGTLFPTMARHTGFAKTIGETSGGGACVVGGIVTAYGTYLRSSSVFQGGTYSEGAFHINEDGITPDYVYARENFYNDEMLNNFLNSLN